LPSTSAVDRPVCAIIMARLSAVVDAPSPTWGAVTATTAGGVPPFFPSSTLASSSP
jgi:hypothetical protein